MPDITNTTRAQTRFLRALKKNLDSLPPDQWPSATLLRRWLRREGFRKALTELLDALRLQADLHLARASARAALHLHQSLEESPNSSTQLLSTLRLSHYRQSVLLRHQPKQPLLPKINPKYYARLLKANADQPWE